MFSPRQSNKYTVLFMFKRRKYMSLQKLLAFSKALSLSRGFIKSKLLWNLSLWGDTLFFACACMCCVSVLCRVVVWTWKPQLWGQDLVYSSASGFSSPTGSQDAICPPPALGDRPEDHHWFPSLPAPQVHFRLHHLQSVKGSFEIRRV